MEGESRYEDVRLLDPKYFPCMRKAVKRAFVSDWRGISSNVRDIIPKVQGATLRHITIWLDRALCRAAAYVAMSREEGDEDYLVAGNVGPQHFIPAQ